MPEPPPFDAVRGAFVLVACVLGLHALSILSTMVECIVNNAVSCQVHDSLRDLFAEVMAVALAFARFPNSPR